MDEDLIRTAAATQAALAATLRDKYGDVLLPGYQAEFDPEEADLAGAFNEDALSEQDALESVIDAPVAPNTAVNAGEAK